MKKTIFFCISSVFISTICISQTVIEIKSSTDTLSKIYSSVEREAQFPGGDAAWFEFLQKNIKPRLPVKKGAPAGIYKVVIKFIVSKDGTLTDIHPETSFGYGMEQEAMRVLKKSPDWIPAFQYGRVVNAYRRQPITFKVE